LWANSSPPRPGRGGWPLGGRGRGRGREVGGTALPEDPRGTEDMNGSWLTPTHRCVGNRMIGQSRENSKIGGDGLVLGPHFWLKSWGYDPTLSLVWFNVLVQYINNDLAQGLEAFERPPGMRRARVPL